MRMKQRLLLSTSHFSRIPLSPNAHEKRLELNFVELLECGLGVALVGSEHCHDVFTSEIAFSTKLVILSRDIDSTIQIQVQWHTYLGLSLLHAFRYCRPNVAFVFT